MKIELSLDYKTSQHWLYTVTKLYILSAYMNKNYFDMVQRYFGISGN